MNFVLARFGHQISQQLHRARHRQQQFERLLKEKPTGVPVHIRTKSPEADLKRAYWTTIGRCSLIAGALLIAFYAFYPEYHPTVSMMPRRAAILHMEHVPETRQQARPSLPRPQVPLAVEGEEVPEEVTIDSTELDMDAIPIDLLALGPVGPIGPISDEPLDYAEIDYKPHPIRIVTPEYPEQARRRRMEGRVMVKVLVDKEGTVEQVDIISGPDMFRDAALVAAQQFRFRPGRHAGERRKVWMIMPIEFSLK